MGKKVVADLKYLDIDEKEFSFLYSFLKNNFKVISTLERANIFDITDSFDIANSKFKDNLLGLISNYISNCIRKNKEIPGSSSLVIRIDDVTDKYKKYIEQTIVLVLQNENPTENKELINKYSSVYYYQCEIVQQHQHNRTQDKYYNCENIDIAINKGIEPNTFIKCKINKIYIQKLPVSLNKIIINEITLNNIEEIKNITSEEKLNLDNVNFNSIKFIKTLPDYLSIKNCNFIYDQDVLNASTENFITFFTNKFSKFISKIYSPNRSSKKKQNATQEKHSEYFNSFKILLKQDHLKHNKEDILKAIAFFDSRKSIFLRILFWFNKAYYSLLWPLIFILVTVPLFWILLQYSKLAKEDYPILLYLFDLKNSFKDIFFKDINYANEISFTKWILLFLFIAFLYSLFSFLVAFKRKFGLSKKKYEL